MSQISSYPGSPAHSKTDTMGVDLADSLHRYAMSVGTAVIWSVDLLCSLGVWLGLGVLGLLMVALVGVTLSSNPVFGGYSVLICSIGVAALLVLAVRWAVLSRNAASNADIE